MFKSVDDRGLYTIYRCKRMFSGASTHCLRRGCNYYYDCINHSMQTCKSITII